MKRAFISITLAVLLASLIIGLAGCGHIAKADAFLERKAFEVGTAGSADNPAMEQMGETTAEGHRRHLRNLRLNRQAMNEDIDVFLHLDEPSRMTERTIP
jgi:hypothetical protein